MKTFIVMLAGLAIALLLPTVVQAAANTSISNLQKGVKHAQAKLDQVKEKGEAEMSSSDKSTWRQAETKFENALAQGKDQKTISAQMDVLKELDLGMMKPSDRQSIEDSRENLVQAYTKLNQAKARLRGGNDDSSQAIQPENRTQNGSNFSIRSQRDSESHPPLPASQ
jgi:hypothetical protein